MKTSIDSLSLKTIYKPIETYLTQIESTILTLLSTNNPFSKEIIHYFFSGRGKFLRPALCLLAARFSPDDQVVQSTLPLAASLEVLHAASLIHDDVVDSAYLRRSLATVNAKWGNKVSVLIGDYLYARALQAVFRLKNPRVYALFLETSIALCEGEILEIREQNNFDLSEAIYLEIIEKKTASLLSACVESGAMMAGLEAEQVSVLKQFGVCFGMAFQIIDDCLDFEGDKQELGKDAGADLNAGVLTLPLIRLISLVSEKQKSEVFKMFKSSPSLEKFEYLSRLVHEYDTIGYAMAKAREWVDRARLELSVLNLSVARTSFEQLLEFVLARRS